MNAEEGETLRTKSGYTLYFIEENIKSVSNKSDK